MSLSLVDGRVRSAVRRGSAAASPRRSRQPRIDGRRVTVRFVALVTRVPAYVRLGWLLARDAEVPGRGRAALVGALGYAMSPIDPVPGIIPIVGQLDDLAVLLVALRHALDAAPESVARRYLSLCGLTRDTLEGDLLTVRATTIWLAHKAGLLAVRAARLIAAALAKQFASAR